MIHYCDECKNRFNGECGGPTPTIEWRDSDWVENCNRYVKKEGE